jgi:hypothetical protein
MSDIGSAKWYKAIDRVVARTAKRISAELDQMVLDLPEGAAPQMALELVVRELAGLQPWFMLLVMEDQDLKESYAAAVPRGRQPLGRDENRLVNERLAHNNTGVGFGRRLFRCIVTPHARLQAFELVHSCLTKLSYSAHSYSQIVYALNGVVRPGAVCLYEPGALQRNNV